MEVQPLLLVHIIKITTTTAAATSTTSSRIASSTTAVQLDDMKVAKKQQKSFFVWHSSANWMTNMHLWAQYQHNSLNVWWK